MSVFSLAVGEGALWLGTRHRGPVRSFGVYQMLKRQAEQAGYEPNVRPH